MNKTKPSPYSFQSADLFLEELIDKRMKADQAAASYVPSPKKQPEAKEPGFARTQPPPTSETPKAPAPAPADSTASAASTGSSGFDLRRMAAQGSHASELEAFAQRESQGYRVDPLSRRRADERLRNTVAGIDAEMRMAGRNERLAQRTRDMVAESKARRTAGTQGNAPGAPAAGPSGTARPQSTRPATPVNPEDGQYSGVPAGFDLSYDQLNLVGDDTLYGTSPDGRRFYLNPGEQPSYLDGQPRPASVAGVLTPTGKLNLEATDYGRQQALKDERARTDALYEKMLSDDAARNPLPAARRSLRQTPQRQLMDLADFTPPLRYRSR